MTDAEPGPTLPSERVVFRDVLRGFALLGVMWVGQHHLDFLAPSTNRWQSFVEWFRRIFAEYESSGLFTFLLGIELAGQREQTATGREGCLEVKGL